MNVRYSRGILYAVTAAMEGCWLYVLLCLLYGHIARDTLPVGTLMAFYPAAFCLGLVLRNILWRRLSFVPVMGALWLVGALAVVKIGYFAQVPWGESQWLWLMLKALVRTIYGLRAEFVTVIGSALAWFLGSRLARLRPDFGATVGEFQFGVVVLLATLFSQSQLGGEIPKAPMIVLGFFVAALIGMSVAHSREGRRWGAGIVGQQWGMVMFLGIMTVVGAALLLSVFINPAFLHGVVHLLKIAGRFVIDIVLKVLEFFMNLFPGSQSTTPPPIAPIQTPQGEHSQWVQWLVMPETVRKVAQFIVGAGWLGLIVAALWRLSASLLRLISGRLGSENVEVESLNGAFKADLARMFRWLFVKMLGLLDRLRGVIAHVDEGSGSSEAAAVRTIYRRLLQWGALWGCRRRTSQTPYEYLVTLVERFPPARDDLEFITERYVKMRYGAVRLSRIDMMEVGQCWERVKNVRPRTRNVEMVRKKEEG